MAKARSAQVSLDATSYYHCVSRCVRRSFLCGVDSYSGQNYEHRRQWVVDRLYKLVGVFAIDLCAFSVMTNHTHLVLRVRRDEAQIWDRSEVIERWHALYAGNRFSQKYRSGHQLTDVENEWLDQYVQVWRERLHDISWFMRNLNEFIAREANREDQCTGRFWEGRFKSQALLDDKALIACMAYVDLNPVRAKMASTPEASDHTSIQLRIHAALRSNKFNQPEQLSPFIGNSTKEGLEGLHFQLEDYLSLVDWTGRLLHDGKRGAINETLPPILERLNFSSLQWRTLTQQFEKQFHQFAGDPEYVRCAASRMGYQRVRGINACQKLLAA